MDGASFEERGEGRGEGAASLGIAGLARYALAFAYLQSRHP